MELTGATIPFPDDREGRETRGDPRSSIDERYPAKQDYIARISKAAQDLVAAGYILAEDVALVVEQSSQRYDHFRFGGATGK